MKLKSPTTITKLTLILIASGLILFTFQQGCHQTHQPNIVENNYLGDKACRACHQNEFDDWKNSHHDLAMQVATDTTVLGNFNNAVFENKGIQTKFFKKDEKFYVNTQGKDGKNHDYEVSYTFGVVPLQQYLVKFPKGKYQTLRTAWDTEKQEWFDLNSDLNIATNEWIHWTGGGMNWNVMCADCHSTNLKRNYFEEADSFHTTWSMINVSCEACHGPGNKHINYISSNSFKKGDTVLGSFLRLTTNLSSIEQVDQCAPCHARRSFISEQYNQEDAIMDHYLTATLRQGLYHADGQILDEVYVYGSFLQSKMYHNNVKCTDCHNPHTLKLRFEGNKLCEQCHKAEIFDVPAHHFHEKNTEGAECVSCHMPGKFYMGNDFRRDHSFRVPRPDLSVKYGVPNACNQCHADKEAKWAAGSIKNWYGPERKFHYSDVLTAVFDGDSISYNRLIAFVTDTSQPAIARASAIEYLENDDSRDAFVARFKNLNDLENIVRYASLKTFHELPATQRMQIAVPFLKDSIRAIRMTAAYLLSNISPDVLGSEINNALQSPLKEYMIYLKEQAYFPGGQLGLGIFHQRRLNFEEAEKAYLKAIELDSFYNQARMNLAILYNENQMNGKAKEMFMAVIALEPNYGHAYYSMGLLLAENGQLIEAEKYLGLASEKDPDNTRIYYNRGLMLQKLGKIEEAEKVLIKGLKIDPNSGDFHYALSILYIQHQRYAEAKYHAEILVALFPDNSEFSSFLKNVNTALNN